MAEQIVKVKIDLDVTEFNKNAKAMSAALSSVLGKDVEIFNGKIAKTKQLVEQTEKAMGAAANSMKGTGDAVKKTNQQFTNLALVVQDLPFGFRGIQNNLPALVGGMAGVSGAFYLAASAAIALYTAYDMGMFKSKEATEKAKEKTEALQKQKDAIDSVYSSTAKEATEVASLLAVLKSETETRNRKLTALNDLKKISPEIFNGLVLEKNAVIGLDDAYKKYIENLGTIIAVKTKQAELEAIIAQRLKAQGVTLSQEEKDIKATGTALNKAVDAKRTDVEVRSKLINQQKKETKDQLLINKYKKEEIAIIKELSQLSSGIKLSDTKTGGKTPEQLAKEKADRIKAANEAESKSYMDSLTGRDKEEYEAGMKLVKDLEVMKAAGFSDSTTYYTTYRANMLEIATKYDNKELEQARKKEEKIAEIVRDNKSDIGNAIAKINDDFAKTEIKDRNAQLSATLKATRGNYQAQKAAIESAIADNEKFKQSAIEAGAGTTLFDENIKNLKATLEGLVDPIEQFELDFNKVINNLATGVLVEFGTQLGNMFSGEGFNMDGFLGMIADAMIQLGTYLVTMSKLFVSIKALFASGGLLAPFMIPIGIAAIAAGVALKSSLGKNKTKKFANGGIISGPTMGLMGEYPGAANNPEVVAPLDKLKEMIGGGGGGGQFVLRGQDLLLSVNRAQKASNLKGQNISLA